MLREFEVRKLRNPVDQFLLDYLAKIEEPISVHKLGHEALLSGAVSPEKAARSMDHEATCAKEDGRTPRQFGVTDKVAMGAKREIYRSIDRLRKRGVKLESYGKRGNTMYKLIERED